MRALLRTCISSFLTRLARFALWLHSPTVIAITGSVGKTTTKDLIACVLSDAGHTVRSSPKSYNDTFGVPLSILGLTTGRGNPFLWCCILLRALPRALVFPAKYVVLEVGLEYPGDISSIASWLRPSTVLLTKLAAVPVHREHFPSTNALYAEKLTLLHAVGNQGSLIYNQQDATTRAVLEKETFAGVLVPFNDERTASGVQYHSHSSHYVEGVPVGTDVSLSIDGTIEPFYIPEVLGEAVAQSLTAAVSVVRVLLPTLSVSSIRHAVASRDPTPGRMRLLSGVEGSILIDDSYNASPASMRAALQTVGLLEGKKKLLILGAMAQLGDCTESAHKEIAALAESVGDTIIGVETDLYGLAYMRSMEEAITLARSLVDLDTVVLCKGSQVARVEKVVSSLLAAHENPATVLVRQEKHWNPS